MLTVMVVCQNLELSGAVKNYVSRRSELRLLDHTDKRSVAVESVLCLAPDIVICEDLEDLTCLELMEQTAFRTSDIWFLICGAAQDAAALLQLLRGGARDVLPAPWAADDLEQAIDRAVQVLSRREQASGTANAAQLRRVLDRKFFEDTVVSGAGTAILADPAAIEDEYQISFSAGWFQAFHLLIDPRPKEQLQRGGFLPMLELEDLVRRFFAPCCSTLVCYVRDRGLSLLLHTPEEIPDSRQLCRQFLAACSQNLSWLQTPNTISVGIGLASRSLKDIPLLMDSAKYAGWMRLSEGRGRVLAYADYCAEYRPRQEYLSPEAADALRCAVRERDADAASRSITEVLEAAPDSGAFIAAATSINDLLCTLFNETCGTVMVENSKYLYLGKNLPPMVENFETTEQIQHAVLQWMTDCIRQLIQADACPGGEAMAAAQYYIQAHYAQPLRLEDAARAVQLTPSYFSMKFHQEVGMTFSSYLTSVRLERAKELLLYSNQKVNEIAVSVGFTDSRHFSRTFRRQYGCLPSAFREKRGSDAPGIAAP